MTDREDKAELLNEFFVSVFLNEGQDKSHIVERQQLGARLPSTDPEMLQSHLEGLDVFKLAGPDELHPRVLKALADVIAQPLESIFEHSWHGLGPGGLEKGQCGPYFQEGEKERAWQLQTSQPHLYPGAGR